MRKDRLHARIGGRSGTMVRELRTKDFQRFPCQTSQIHNNIQQDGCEEKWNFYYDTLSNSESVSTPTLNLNLQSANTH